MMATRLSGPVAPLGASGRIPHATVDVGGRTRSESGLERAPDDDWQHVDGRAL